MNSYFEKLIHGDRLRDKPIYIFGANLLGLGLLRALINDGYQVLGFGDDVFVSSDPVLWYRNVPLYTTETLAEVIKHGSSVYICCTTQNQMHRYLPVYIQLIEKAECRLLWNPTEVYIDVSGNCNLRCRSCQVANHNPNSFHYAGRGCMTWELFCLILDKVQREIPECTGVFLFNYGEPLLCHELPKMIRELHRRGLVAVVSSNLSLDCNLQALVDAEPDVLKISVSGFTQEIYETTHNGGNISLVLSNMSNIRLLAEKHEKAANVLVGFHLYTNNYDEVPMMQKFCQDLHYIFQPKKAMFCNLPKLMGLDPFSESDKSFIRTFYPNWKDILDVNNSKRKEAMCRNMAHRLFLDYNGDVLLCFMVLHDDAVFDNYLDTSLSKIRQWQKSHAICSQCIQSGLHCSL